jgi:hypothetical protein
MLRTMTNEPRRILRQVSSSVAEWSVGDTGDSGGLIVFGLSSMTFSYMFCILLSSAHTHCFVLFAAEGNVAAIRVLSEHGADLTLEDRWKNKVKDEAQRCDAKPLLEFLKGRE